MIDPPPPPPSGSPPAWTQPEPPAWAQPQPARRRWGWIIAAIGIAAVLVVAGLFVIGKKVTPPSAATTGTSAFTDPTSHFSAQYQGKPVEDDQTKAVGAQSIKEVLWSDTIDFNTAEIVGYTDFPADFSVSTPNAALDGSVNGEVTNSHGTLVSKNFGTYQGFHSVDAVISTSGGYAETRTVLAGRTLYVIVVTSLSNPPELFAGFANSLHIINHAS